MAAADPAPSLVQRAPGDAQGKPDRDRRAPAGHGQHADGGTAAGRGTISGRDWQRPELQQRYGEYFSGYLLRRIRRAG